MADLAIGASSKEVLALQESINALRKSKVVPENGAFDQKTQDELKRLQGDLKLQKSGKADKATLDAIAFNLVPRFPVKLWGVTYYLAEDELFEGRTIASKIVVGHVEQLGVLVREAEIYFSSLERAREENVMGPIVEAFKGVSLPKRSLLDNANRAYLSMLRDATYGADFDIKARSKPIFTALKAISEYRNAVYRGMWEAETAATAAVVIALPAMAVISAIAGAMAGPATGTLIAAGSSSFSTFVTEVTRKSKTNKLKGTIPSAITDAFVSAAVSAFLSYLTMIPGGQKKFTEAVVDEAMKGASAKGAKEAVKAYLTNAFTSGTVKAVEAGLGKLGDAAKNPKKTLKPADVAKATGQAFAVSTALSLVSGVAGKYFSGANKQFTPQEVMKGYKDIDYEKVWSAGVSASVDQAGKLAVGSTLESLDPKQAKKVETIIRKAILEDPKLKAKIKALAKKHKK
ncbi:MAG: peptidoglycan-binding protein [Pseudomonadota bacterium]